MPRIFNDYHDDEYMHDSQHTLDLHLSGDAQNQYQSKTTWLSDHNSYYNRINPGRVFTGNIDDISRWEWCTIRLSTTENMVYLKYQVSMDGGETFPFEHELVPGSTFYSFPLVGQYGRLVFQTDSTSWDGQSLLQIATMYKRNTSTNTYANVDGNYTTSNHYKVIPKNTRGLNVRVINDWFDDYIRGLVDGRSTGFLAGYSNDISAANFQSVTNIASGYLNHPPLVGVNNLRTSSSSPQDSGAGTGIAAYFFVLMLTDFSITAEVVFMNGITPVNFLTINVYRIIAGFAFSGGSNYNNVPTVGSNAGVIYVGVGTFSTSSGFVTNYAVNRIGDGTIVVPTYTCPKGKRATLWELKYGTDGINPVIFRTMGKDTASSPWQLIIEDVATATIQPTRSLIGGWRVPGGEWTVLGKRRGGTNALGNVIGTIIEIDEKIFETAPGVP